MSVTNGVITVLPAPAGYHVDFAHPQRSGIPQTYWIVGIGNFLSLLFFAQRVYAKVSILRKVNWDDAFFVLSWACCVTVQVLCCHLYASGSMGIHAWEMSTGTYSNFSLLVMVSSAIYAPGTCFAKLSLLCFYFRLTEIRWFRLTTWFMLFFVIGGYLGIFFSLVFGCTPVRKTWDVTTEGTCVNTAAVYIATAVLGVVTDLILLAMPIPIVLGLQLRTLQKAGLIVLFAIGSMTLVTSIIRLVLLFPMLVDFDQTWAVVSPFTWICVEANLLVICASLCTLRRFAQTMVPRLMPTTFGASRNTGRSSGQSNVVESGSRNHHKSYSRVHNSFYALEAVKGPEQGEVERLQSMTTVEDGDDARASMRTKSSVTDTEHGIRPSAEGFNYRA